jgi:hypothetical protein
MNARALALVALLGCDPVRSDAVAALGGEAPGVPHGPTHRPGQPCLVCHNNFAVAGTVFLDAIDRKGANGIVVHLTDSQDTAFDATTNEVGNFFVRTEQYHPVYPMKVELRYANMTVKMVSDVGRNGACGSCHFDPPGPGSPGHVFAPADGVTP